MRVLVLGGTGTVGAHVVRELLARRVDVEVLTRDASKRLPAGARATHGDLLDPGTVRTIFPGQDGVFLLNAVSTTEAHEGLMAVNGAAAAGVKRLVYLSVHKVDQAPHLPHFGAKICVEAALRASGIPTTILRPNNFYQNDFWCQQALLEYGVYPQPIGDAGLSRVDVRDIAEAAAIALTTAGHEGHTYDLVGPDAHTGRSTADAWSRALGRSVAYAGDDVDPWEKEALKVMPAAIVYDLRLMFEFFQRRGLKADPGAVERLTQLLGHAPRSFDDFARETAKQWRG